MRATDENLVQRCQACCRRKSATRKLSADGRKVGVDQQGLQSIENSSIFGLKAFNLFGLL